MTSTPPRRRRDIVHLWTIFRFLQKGRSPWLPLLLPVLMVVRGLLEAVSLSVLVMLLIAASKGAGTVPLPIWLPGRTFLRGWLPEQTPLLGLMAAVLAVIVFKNGIYVAIAQLRARLVRVWFTRLTARLCNHHQAASSRPETGYDSVAAGIRATDSAVRVVNTYLLAVMDGLGELWVVIALLGLFGWTAGPLVLVSLVVPGGLIWLGHRWINRNANHYSMVRQRQTAALQRWMQNGNACSREIELYGCRRAFADRHAGLASTLGDAAGRQRYAQDMMVPMVEAAGILGIFLLTLSELGGTAGDPTRLIAGLAISVRLLPCFRRLAGVMHTMSFFRADLLSVMDVLNEPISAEPAIREETSGAIAVFDQVHFTHPVRNEERRSRHGLRSISLSLVPGTWTALIGPSGIGKSTLVDLLLGRLQPEKGDVRWAGGSREGTGYLGPAVVLLDATLRDNLAFPDGSRLNDDEIWQALRMAQAADIASRFPAGLEQPIAGLAASLSQGEGQRLGLARAILHANRLLILDEATAGLDLAVEEKIFHALRQSRPHLAVLLITHRPTTARQADIFLSLSEGTLRPLDKASLDMGDTHAP